jgi:hypothetical protein
LITLPIVKIEIKNVVLLKENPGKMESPKLLKYTKYIFTGFFFTCIFLFFALFYNNHLHFEEQSQLFLLTGDYFISKINLPGGFSGWVGGFLTQFYYLSVVGPLIITALLLGIQQVTLRILASVNNNYSFFPLSFLPSLNAALMLCDEFYPLSGIIGFLIALLSGWLYISITKNNKRFLIGIILIILTYLLTGGSYLMLLSVMIIYEILEALKTRKKSVAKETGFKRLKIWQIALFLIVAAGIPLLVRQFLILQPLGLSFISEFYYNLRTVVPTAIPIFFALPGILMILMFFLPSTNKQYLIAVYVQIALIIAAGYFGSKLWANFSAEEIMKYDYLVRKERWNDVIKFAEKKPPRNNLSLAMLNLSLAKTEKMGDLMFNFEQNGIDGLFLPFKKEYVAPMIGSEILFQLGLINASQEYSFESTETTPNLGKMVRSVKRLAETNLINGNYEVAGKYLKLLKKTIFYRKWAKDTERYLYNENLINKHPVWGEKRQMMIKQDFFFKVQNMEPILNMLLRDDPQNKIAYQYLMAFYLINKDLRNFMNRIPMMNDLGYTRIPVSYQEAIMYVIGLTSKNPMENIPYKISEDTKLRMKAYAEIYTTNKNAQELLSRRFSGTYWYYFHYKQIEIVNDEK